MENLLPDVAQYEPPAVENLLPDVALNKLPAVEDLLSASVDTTLLSCHTCYQAEIPALVSRGNFYQVRISLQPTPLESLFAGYFIPPA